MPLRPYPRTAPDWVADQLRALILAGEWKVGQTLLNERELGRQFGVSRTTLRAAISMLVKEGFLSVDRPFGTCVRNWEATGGPHLVEVLLGAYHGTGGGQLVMRDTLWLRATLYRRLPELLCRPEVDLGDPYLVLADLTALFRYPDDIPGRKVLVEEEKLLCGLAATSGNGPAKFLAHSIRRALEAAMVKSTACIETDSSHARFEALLAALTARDHQASEKLFDALCELREPQYLELVTTPLARGAAPARQPPTPEEDRSSPPASAGDPT